MLLQRLATGATAVKQARYRREGSEAPVRACAVYTQPVYIGRSLALAVQCETTHGVYEFSRGFCTLVLHCVSIHVCQSKVALVMMVPSLFDMRLCSLSSISCSTG